MLTVGTDSYISLADATDYIVGYVDENFTSTGNEATVERFLKQATLAIERIYGPRFIGTPTSPTQALHFPVDASTTIPLCVAHATAELAFMMMDQDLNPYVQPNPTIKKLDQQVDALKESTEYAFGHSENPLYRIELIMAAVLYAKSGILFADVVVG